MNESHPTEIALVTGACSGIGLAIARELADRGHALILVSHRDGPLQDAAARLHEAFGVDVTPVVMNLATSQAAQDLVARVESLGKEVSILVNNAGVFFFGEAADSDLDEANALLQLHVVTPSILCAAFGRVMRERRRGHIMLVSSISAWRDFPGIAFYGSSKRYLRSFASSLRSELSVWGVNVTCLAPGPVATNLYDPARVDMAKARRYRVMMAPERVARAGVHAMFQGKGVCIPGWSSYWMAIGASLLPQFIVDVIRRRGPWLGRPGFEPEVHSRAVRQPTAKTIDR